MSIETFLSLNFSDNMILSLQLLSVTENDVKIRPISINSEFILFIMNLLKSRYAYSNLNIEFWHTSLWHCTIHFKFCVICVRVYVCVVCVLYQYGAKVQEFLPKFWTTYLSSLLYLLPYLVEIYIYSFQKRIYHKF